LYRADSYYDQCCVTLYIWNKDDDQIRTTILQSHVHMQVTSWDNNKVVMLMSHAMGNSCSLRD